VTLIGDVGRLRQIMINLLSNASKFTETGYIEISMKISESRDDVNKDGHVILESYVTDTGIGISPDDQKRLFTAFTQVDPSFTRRYGGTGLGLAICKRLVSVMGGEIGVQSTIDEGSTFWFKIPLPLSPSPYPSRMEDASSLKVAILDTEKHLFRILQRWHADVSQVSETDELYSLIRKKEINVIFLSSSVYVDLFEVRAKVVQTINVPWSPTKRVYFIGLLKYSERKLLRSLRKEGFLGHILRPVKINHAIKVIQQIKEMNNKNEEKKHRSHTLYSPGETKSE